MSYPIMLPEDALVHLLMRQTPSSEIAYSALHTVSTMNQEFAVQVQVSENSWLFVDENKIVSPHEESRVAGIWWSGREDAQRIQEKWDFKETRLVARLSSPTLIL